MNKITAIAPGFIFAILSYLFRFDSLFRALVLIMVLDMITGIICAAFFKNSPKTTSGTLNSKELFKGFCKKIVMIIIVALAVRLDVIFDTGYIRTITISVFIANESLSIIENAGVMGVPIPDKMRKMLDVLIEGGEPR